MVVLLLVHAGCCLAQVTLPNPVMFVTQVPQPGDFTAIGSTFGNHLGKVGSAPRGGDLWIRYPDGTQKNLTSTAGYGQTGLQGAAAIAVREPCVHWSGTKALFSMVVGSPAHFQVKSYFWQIYEVTGIGQNEIPVITKVTNQPATYNNVSPIYGSDDRIIFTSDRPRDGQAHLYPQRDEYESAPTVTGLWSLDPATGDLKLLQHSPSGSFTPLVDSFGRVVFTRWDHLQRDQQADSDVDDVQNGGAPGYGTFNFVDESPTSPTQFNVRTEVFPEERGTVGSINGLIFNQFFPWMINQDGTEEETLNHVGRHELSGYINRSFNNDPNVQEFYNPAVTLNPNRLNSFLHIREDPQHPGRYFGVYAPEFGTHAAGQLLSMEGAPSVNPDNFFLSYHTPRSTAFATPDGDTPEPDHTGLYRNPLPLSDGKLLAVHTAETRADQQSPTGWQSRYDFRVKLLEKQGAYYVPGTPVSSGISKSVSWYDPDVLRSYSGELWELDPVEVRARPRPAITKPVMPSVEASVFAQESVHIPALKEYLKSKNLALIISRNVTTRDHADIQQPFNLRVNTNAGVGVQTIGAPGTIYDVRYLQLFQGDLIRGMGMQQATSTPSAGRRVLAQALHDANAAAVQPPTTGPAGSVKLGQDGSMAAFVPARRAVTWHLSSPSSTPVVRERYWLDFQPGEICTCTSCHGVNTRDQANQPPPTNEPEALRTLLQHWKTITGLGAAPKIAWQQEKFGSNASDPAIAGDLADPDGDGVANLLEYAFASEPMNRGLAALPQSAIVNAGGAAQLAFTFQRSLNATDVKYQVEVSTNLQTWTFGNTYSYDNDVTSTPDMIETARSGSPVQSITVRTLNTTSSRQFIRLRVIGL